MGTLGDSKEKNGQNLDIGVEREEWLPGFLLGDRVDDGAVCQGISDSGVGEI